MQKTLRITGRGKVAASPDIIILSFDVECHEWEYEKAINKLNHKVNSLRETIESVGIDKTSLKTKDFRINKDTSWQKEEKKYVFNGFRATHDMELEVPLDNDLINKLILRLVENISNLDFKIAFGVKEPDKFKDILIQNAISQAKNSANIITKASGVKLGSILNIDYSFDELFVRSSNIDFEMNESMCSMEDSMPDMQPDDIKLAETITLTWEIL